MNISSTVEMIEPSSGQMLARIKLGNKEFFSRHIPIGNRVAFLEDRRINGFNHEPFNSQICFSSIPTFREMELKEYIKQYNVEMFKQKANETRICLSGVQRSDEDREYLDGDDALETCNDFVESGVENVPIEVPLNYNLIQWKKLKRDVESILSSSQRLIADTHCFQDHNHIRDILQFEIDEGSKFVYVTCRTVNDADNLAVYGEIWNIMRKIKEGNPTPIIVGKNITRYQAAYGNVSSTFALNCFNIGVVAEKFYLVPENVRRDHNRHGPDEYTMYDPEEGSFVRSQIQELLNRRSLVRETLQNNNLMQGVGPYEAMLCNSFILQQEDTFLQNNLLTSGQRFSDVALQKTQWSAFYTNCVRPFLLRFN